MEVISTSTEETKKLAQEIATKLKGGETLALYGDLGSGKTTFTQGLALGLGIKEKILSPTFILIRPYEIKEKGLDFYHIDLYRLETEKEIEGLNLNELLGKKENIVAIEWPEKIEKVLPKNTIKIYFESLSEKEKKIKI